ncbi:hypothetical protein BC828DRAFT_416622 [Blastocladiella britannica]|nr:hypothetical protein BC828DRAFT_416622 [Blastocladiella britannica]
MKKRVKDAEAANQLSPEQTARRSMLSWMDTILETILHEPRTPLSGPYGDARPVGQRKLPAGVLSIPEAAAHLELLATTVPAWCSTVDVGMLRHFELLPTTMSLAEAKNRVFIAMNAIVVQPPLPPPALLPTALPQTRPLGSLDVEHDKQPTRKCPRASDP